MTLFRPRLDRNGKWSLRGNEDRYKSVETVAKFSGASSVPSPAVAAETIRDKSAGGGVRVVAVGVVPAAAAAVAAGGRGARRDVLASGVDSDSPGTRTSATGGGGGKTCTSERHSVFSSSAASLRRWKDACPQSGSRARVEWTPGAP